jgi:hypothetical protein
MSLLVLHVKDSMQQRLVSSLYREQLFSGERIANLSRPSGSTHHAQICCKRTKR